MPLVSAENISQYWEPQASGPVAQSALVLGPNADPNLLGTLPTTGTIAASGNWTSSVVVSDGFKAIGVGATSSQTGVITIQRYLDRSGNIPVGAPITANLTAATAQWATVNDAIPFQSFKVSISNTGASPATVTNFEVLLAAN